MQFNKDVTPVELQAVIKKFVLAVRKKNGDGYEPSSISQRAFVQSINRYLQKKNYYEFSVLNNKEFDSYKTVFARIPCILY